MFYTWALMHKEISVTSKMFYGTPPRICANRLEQNPCDKPSKIGFPGYLRLKLAIAGLFWFRIQLNIFL